MTYFLKSGNTFRPSSEAALDLHYTLPLGTYTIKMDQFGNYFLQVIENFEIKGKRYGDNVRNTNRIFDTFISRYAATGVMLAGEKGSGKSLLAKSLAIKGLENDIPTIVINEAWCGESFNQFIQNIEQPVIIIFDEFEKVYDKDDQEKILTLLDGVYPSKKLFVLTCNNKYKVDEHMRNRPGRIFYMIDFKGLTPEFITEYCEDNLDNKQYIDQLCKISLMFDQFNFDMLKAIVEEMNRYNETPQQVMELLNVKPEYSTQMDYDVNIELLDGSKIIPSETYPHSWKGNPLTTPLYVNYTIDDGSEDGIETGQNFTPFDVKDVNVDEHTFTYYIPNVKLVLSRKKLTRYDYFSAL